MSEIFPVIFYMKLAVEKYILNLKKKNFTFRFKDIIFFQTNPHFIKSEKIHINLIKYIKIFEPY